MGLALTSCVVPAAGTPTFDLADDEVEVGIGIHGEPGRRREKLAPVDDMAEWLARPDRVRPRARSAATRSSRSSTGWAARRSSSCTSPSTASPGSSAAQGIAIGRSLVGNYITSLEMAGFSVTLLAPRRRADPLWDAPVHTPALRWGV